VWELPAGSSCYIFAVCDGYDSKLAIPNDSALAQVLFSPREYLNGDFLHNTCTSVYAPNNQGHDVRSKLQHIRDSIHAQLDDRWRTAFDESWEYVYTVLDSAADPQLRPDTLASISLASHICVLLLSDDNVSTEVLLVDPCADDVDMPLQPAEAEAAPPLFEYSDDMHQKGKEFGQTLPAYPVSPNNPNGTYGLRRNVTLVQEREEQVSRFPSAPGALVTAQESARPAAMAKVASLPAGGAQQSEIARNASAPPAAFTDYAGLTARLQAGATDQPVQPVVRRPEGMTINASDRSNSGLITLEEETSWSRSRNNSNV